MCVMCDDNMADGLCRNYLFNEQVNIAPINKKQ